MSSRKRVAATIRDDQIDFSAVTAAKETHSADAIAKILRGGADADGGDGAQQRQQSDSLVKAFDPTLGGYTQRKAAGAVGRRRLAFGGPSTHHQQQQQQQQEAEEQHTAKKGIDKEEEEEVDWEALRRQQAAAALGFLATTTTAAPGEDPQQQQQSTAQALEERRASYEASLRAFCTRELPWAGGSSSSSSNGAPSPSEEPCLSSAGFPLGQCASLLTQLFADGVPDIEPWDRWAFALPRYDAAALVVAPAKPKSASGVCDLCHHPVLPESHYTAHHQHAHAARPVAVKLHKTREELKAERRERLKKKQEEKRKAAAAAAAEGGVKLAADDGAGGGLYVSSSAAAAHDRLSTRSLTHTLLGSSILNPIAAEAKVLTQYEQRFHDHQQRNHDRHVAALPNQILKRERDAARYAAENPVLRAYRVYPIYGQSHLGKLRNFANDNRLRGFVLWVGQCDALIVLAGGEVAARHLDRWIMHKMAWESAETTATRLVSLPLQDAASFSFHLKGSGAGKAKDRRSNPQQQQQEDGKRSSGTEAVYMKQCATVAEAEAFMRELPVDSPWGNLSSVWRAAFLADGLHSAPPAPQLPVPQGAK